MPSSSGSRALPIKQPRVASISKSVQFAQALTAPFAPSSMGCRVPDPYFFPTATYHAHSTSVFTSTAAGTAGAVFFPNPVVTMLDSTYSYAASPCILQVNTGMAPLTASGFTSHIFGATAPGLLKNVFTDYRVVSQGIKITNLQPELSATGRFYYAQIPLADTMPSYDVLIQTGATAPDSNIIPSMTGGYPYTALFGSNFINLPSAVEIGISDILQGDLQICNNVVNSAYYTFKSTAPVGFVNAAGYQEADDIVESSAFATGQGGYKDLTRCNGACAILVWAEGLPVSSNVFQIEHIVHLEGSPVLANGVAGP